jgi:hypothetical protein
MKILEQCDCKESDLPPVKMQYLLNFHFKELETALCDELLKLKWNVECVKPGDQCLSIEGKNHTDDCVLEDVILLLCDEVNKVNFCQSMQASKHPELLLKEYIDRGHLTIYVDDKKVFVVGIVENPRKVIEMLRKKPIGSDYSRTSAYKMDVQLDNQFTGQLLIYLQFLPSMKQKHSSVNVTVDEERSIMSICGNNLVDVHAAVEDVDIFTKTIAVEYIELDPLLIQLLKLQDIKTLIRKLCEEQDLKVIWTLSELNNTITCHCKDRKAVQYFSDVLKHNLEKKTYQYSKRSLGDKTMIFSTTNMFSDFVKKYDGKCLVSTVEGNSIDIFTTRGISNELALLEVNFEGTKIDIQKNLTQNEKKEIHNQKSEVTIADDGIEWIDGTKRRLNVEVKLFMSKIGFKSIESLPTSVLKFYDSCDIVKKTIAARLGKMFYICHWYIDLNESSLKMFTPDRESLFTAECEMLKEYPNTDCANELVLELGLFLKNGNMN